MGLKEYKAKRKFTNTPEPEGKVKKGKGTLKFVIQKHHASHLHYDFRLEMDGVLKSWAIPKGPSMNPGDKRLAMMVEDHPIEYGGFEGIIPKGNYGAGTVMIWDEGVYYSSQEEGDKALKKGLYEGNLKFIMKGKKLKGEFALVRLKTGKGNEWLLIKKKDEYASEEDITKKDKSVISKRTLEEIKNQSGHGELVWHSNKGKDVIEPGKGAIKSEMLHDVKPMMATLVDAPFDSDEWIYEIKWDGYRAISEINFNKVSLYSRNNLSFNKDFPELTESLSALGLQVVLDGEICALDEEGKPSFQLIQNYKRTGKGSIVYYVFDILYYNGNDLTSVPLIERKEFLKKILPDVPTIRYSDHVEGQGIKFFELIKQQEMEGIMAKKANSLYHTATRGKDWLKIKVISEQEAVIAGYTEPRGGRKHFGSLVLGVYKDNEFVYIGHSGGGFNDTSLKELSSKLAKLKTEACPFKTKPKTNMPVTWVRPELVCEVKFQEWTNEGLMRQPIFLGLRVDKSPKEVIREKEKPAYKLIENEKKRNNTIKIKSEDSISEIKTENKKISRRSRGAGSEVKNRKPVSRSSSDLKEKKSSKKTAVKTKAATQTSDNRKKKATSKKLPERKDVHSGNLIKLKDLNAAQSEAQVTINKKSLKFTNLKKVYWPEEGYTKQDLLEYYDRIAPYILPYLKDRPESLRRNPNGYAGQSFFQKDMPDTIPDWIETVQIYSESSNKEINYMICQDKADLLYMANLGCIELNPWSSRKQKLDYPDYIVIDLDPQDVEFEQVIEVALAVKKVLDKGKIKGFCKTSGSRGLHIYIPMEAKYDYDHAKQFAQLIASLTHELVPEITSLERMPNKRKNKIYLDFLQNRKGQTLAAPYCVRPKAGATVSTPLEWDELKKGLHPSQFTIKTIFDRLKEKGDLFKGIFGKGVDMEKVLKKLKS